MRQNGRRPDQLRPIEIIRGFTSAPPGSVLIRAGRTMVLCTASITPGVPKWREESGFGWLTAEYDMLPAATGQRRERNRQKIDGRTQEIQRLIGRSLRVAVNLERVGPYTLTIDCDVLEADGGTRTAAITGGYIALVDALRQGEQRGLWGGDVRASAVAAVSVGLVGDTVLLDLDYREDAAARVDCNLVLASSGEWVETQATGESGTFGDRVLEEMLALGRAGLRQLFEIQQSALSRELVGANA